MCIVTVTWICKFMVTHASISLNGGTERIVSILKGSADGVKTEEVSRCHGICPTPSSAERPNTWTWRSSISASTRSWRTRSRLKGIVAEQPLDIHALKVVDLKKSSSHLQRCEAVGAIVRETEISERRTCRWIEMHRWTFRYPGKPRDDRSLRERMWEPTDGLGSDIDD